MYRRARNNSCVLYGFMEREEHTAIKEIGQGWEALDPLLGLIFPSQGLALARQCIILTHGSIGGVTWISLSVWVPVALRPRIHAGVQ